ncbi:MAG: S8 family serine peptidase, partial [Acidobacteria bacterium]|nr:S8 family serine peptidase [Acidobacteriota bacterium]
MARMTRKACLFKNVIVFTLGFLIVPLQAGRVVSPMSGESLAERLERRLSPEVLEGLIAGIKARDPNRKIQVIVQFENNVAMADNDSEMHYLERRRLVESMGGQRLKNLSLIQGMAMEVPLERLIDLVEQDVVRISSDAEVRADSDSAVSTNPIVQITGADQAQSSLGLVGKNVVVAVIDSGISINDGLSSSFGLRLITAKDFTASGGTGKDQHGHGTHVAGIIGANLEGRNEGFSGMAPGSRVIALKALGDDGSGRTSDVIAAFNWCVQNKNAYGIRIINLSAGHPPRESYKSDPLSLAAQRAVEAGMIVVA